MSIERADVVIVGGGIVGLTIARVLVARGVRDVVVLEKEPTLGRHAWRTECSDTADAGLHGVEGALEVVPNTADNLLYEHGPIRVADDHRHFAHADGTPFLWLGDTWWKCLCKRMTWEGFQ